MEGGAGIDYRLDAYDYELPECLIAQHPSERRGASRLLLLDRSSGTIEHGRFEEVPERLEPGDLVVVNDTRVVPARLYGVKETGGRVELLVLDPHKPAELGREEGYVCLVKASKRPQPSSFIELQGGVQAQVLTSLRDGKARVRFPDTEPFLNLLERIGQTPLPPYITRENGGAAEDAAAYQTVYARRPGAVAAPTAGLHFSESLLENLRRRNIETTALTLHVGYGTFSPLRVEDIRDHRMHAEYAEVPPESAERIERARREKRRIIAVGTTVVRTLEWVSLELGAIGPYSGYCRHYIYPGYRFRVVDGMITNFHLPKSSLLLLVSAFAGQETILGAYREAVEKGYRFFSYGDAMLIL